MPDRNNFSLFQKGDRGIENIELSKYYERVLAHELTHGFSITRELNTPPGKLVLAEKLISDGKFEADGDAKAKSGNADIPNNLSSFMFAEQDGLNGPLETVGGTDWMEDVYNSVRVGEPADYEHDFSFSTDEAELRLHEAANVAFWAQIAATEDARDDKRGIPLQSDNRTKQFVGRKYAASNANETLAGATDVLRFKYDESDIRELQKIIPT